MPQSICELLTQKKELFDAYAQATEAMLSCEIEHLEHYITKRSELIVLISEIDRNVEALCAQEPNPEMTRAAINNSAEYDALPEELRAVFHAGQEVLGLVQSITNNEEAVRAHLLTLRDDCEKNIRRVSKAPKVTQYLRSLGSGAEDFNRLMDKA